MSWKKILKEEGLEKRIRFTDWMKMRDVYYNGLELQDGKLPNSIFQIAGFTKHLYEDVTDTELDINDYEYGLDEKTYDPDDFSGLGSLFGPSQTEINLLEKWFDIHEGKIHVSEEGEKYFKFLIDKFKVGKNWIRGVGDLVILKW